MRHLAIALVLLFAGVAHAGLVVATFQSTGVDYPGHGSLAVGGEPMWISLTLDNSGPASLANQSWGPQDFISMRFFMDAGLGYTYTFMSDEIDPTSSGMFSTDSNGMLLPGVVTWGIDPAPNAVNIFGRPEGDIVLSEGQGAWGIGGFLYSGGYPVVRSTGGSYVGSVADNPSLTANWSIAAVPEASQLWCFTCLVVAAVGRFVYTWWRGCG
jgi:hypothetical protein